MAQNNKPHKRTVRDSGLSSNRTRYAVPNEKRRKVPVVPILVAAAILVAGIGFFASGQNNPNDEQQQPAQEQQAQQQDQQTQQPADSVKDKADKDTGASADSKDSKSSKDSDKDSSDSSSSSSESESASSSDDDSSTATSKYAEEQAGVTQGEEDDSNWQGGDNGSYASTGSDDGSGSDSSDDGSDSGSDYSSEKGYDGLKKYYNSLDKQSDKLSDFVNDVYNSHLFSKLSVRKADYQDFLKLKKSILGALGEADDAWNVDDVSVSKSLKSTKSELHTASNLLKKRIDIIESGYKAINALPKSASNKKIQKANDEACKDSASTYAKYTASIDKVESVLG